MARGTGGMTRVGHPGPTSTRGTRCPCFCRLPYVQGASPPFLNVFYFTNCILQDLQLPFLQNTKMHHVAFCAFSSPPHAQLHHPCSPTQWHAYKGIPLTLVVSLAFTQKPSFQ